MGYSNYVTVKVIEKPVIEEPIKRCINPNCIKAHPMDLYFCGRCGSQLEETVMDVEIDDVIARFREYSDEAAFALEDNGKSGEPSTNAGAIPDILKKFSKEYPNALFQVDIDWDQGFGEPPSRYFVKEGKMQECKTRLIFDEYDPQKLK